MTPSDKQKKLDEIAKQMEVEIQYELAKHANLVPGEGSANAEVMFIGEAPGADEDHLKRPFVGRSGQLLRLNIRSIGWKEADVYITNVVKHRPPANRDPFPDEILQNKVFLDQQIETIDPLLIVTLGRFSMGKFFADTKISQIHGKVFKINFQRKKRFVFPLYHPAAALRSTAMKEQFELDFKKLPKILEWVRKQKPDLELQATVEEFLL
ncbi:MAG: uracil-DNA glycosylase [Patescibacteria group bacterium]